MRASLKNAVRKRFGYRCGYCGVEEADVGSELTLDHFQPRSRGGNDTTDNLVYCCYACNQYKGHYWEPDGDRRLLHPLQDDLSAHLMETRNGRLKALTTQGQIHLVQLHLNRPALCVHRKRQQTRVASLTEQQATQQQLDRLTRQVERLQEQVMHLASSETIHNE